MRQDVKFDFKNKNYIVVGASSGIGKRVTEEILIEGGTVLAVARDYERLSSIFSGSKKIYTKSVDVRDRTQLEAEIYQFVLDHGKFHGSIYTAGISKTTLLNSFSQEVATEIMDINFWGWINLMKIINKKKYSVDGCSNVVVASVAAYTGEAGNFAYSASKSALLTSVKTFAKEIYRRSNRVNSVSPGFIKSPMSDGFFDERGFSDKVKEKHLLGLGEPEDVSGLILYLLSERARWITGSDFVIDGGYLVSN